jgi:hypothetical protein
MTFSLSVPQSGFLNPLRRLLLASSSILISGCGESLSGRILRLGNVSLQMVGCGD